MIRRFFLPLFLSLGLAASAQNAAETPAQADSITYEATVIVSIKNGNNSVPVRSYNVTTPYASSDTLVQRLLLGDFKFATENVIDFGDSLGIQVCPEPGMTGPEAFSDFEEVKVKKPAPKIVFAWGGDVGASIDMSGNDMSSIDFNLAFGIRRGWIKFLGVGAQADIYVSNSCRSYPIYALLRTNFVERDTRVFWEVKGGMSLNYLEHNHHQTGIFGSTGVGMRLASGRSFSSYLVLAYTFLQRRKIIGPEMTHDFTDLHCASVRLGIVF